MLEYWNNGSWDIAILGKWQNSSDRLGLNIQSPLKTHYSIVPLFHYSMIEAKIHALKKPHIFIQL
jgi:hypothetical protein